MRTQWRDVAGYAGLYEVSNDGQVRNAVTGAIVKQFQVDGYNKVVLCRGALDKRAFRVDKLVAKAFVPNTTRGRYVIHKDKCRHNDAASNLIWSSSNDHALSKPVIVLNKYGQLLSSHNSATAAAEQYGYSTQLISRLCNNHGSTRTGLGFRYYKGDQAYE